MFKITARLKEIQSNHSRAEAANVINTLRCQLEAFQRFFKKCLKKEKPFDEIQGNQALSS